MLSALPSPSSPTRLTYSPNSFGTNLPVEAKRGPEPSHASAAGRLARKTVAEAVDFGLAAVTGEPEGDDVGWRVVGAEVEEDEIPWPWIFDCGGHESADASVGHRGR